MPRAKHPSLEERVNKMSYEDLVAIAKRCDGTREWYLATARLEGPEFKDKIDIPACGNNEDRPEPRSD